MTPRPRQPGETTPGARRRRGFTLIEAVMSVLVVGLMLVGVLNTIGASHVTQQRTTEHTLGPVLAHELMAEILNQAYEEPDDTVNFGRESSESGGDRTDWDDVDDYDGWSASPPQSKSGNVLPGLEGWQRQVSVNWASSLNPSNNSALPSGIKRIDVKVVYQGRTVGQATALRTGAWPDSDTPAVPPIRVVMVVDTPAALTSGEAQRKALLESMGCIVSLIQERWTDAEFDAAEADNEVIFVPSHITRDGKARVQNTTLGVVAESEGYITVMGFAGRTANGGNGKTITVITSGHYITSPFSLGSLTIFTSNSAMTKLSGSISNEMRTLGTINLEVCLATLDTGDERYDRNLSAGRRVMLPWSKTGFDVSLLNDNGKTLLKRSLQWAAGMEIPD